VTNKPAVNQRELSYDQLAARLRSFGLLCKTRWVREIVRQNSKIITPRRYSYKVVRFDPAQVNRLIAHLKNGGATKRKTQ
jgi:hypothetical protein